MVPLLETSTTTVINLFGYRLSWAQLAWFGHRASGLGVLLFLFLHIVETSTVLLGPEVYDFTQTFYQNLPAKLGEVLLMAALVYHALNGLRVIAMDFWPGADRLLPAADLRRDRRHRRRPWCPSASS